MTTKAKLAETYRELLIENYEWAKNDPDKLEHYMIALDRTLNGKENLINLNSPMLKLACKTIKVKASGLTYKYLKSLPE